MVTDQFAGYPDVLMTTRNRLKKRQLLLLNVSAIQETNGLAVNYYVELKSERHPISGIVFFQVRQANRTGLVSRQDC